SFLLRGNGADQGGLPARLRHIGIQKNGLTDLFESADPSGDYVFHDLRRIGMHGGDLVGGDNEIIPGKVIRVREIHTDVPRKTQAGQVFLGNETDFLYPRVAHFHEDRLGKFLLLANERFHEIADGGIDHLNDRHFVEQAVEKAADGIGNHVIDQHSNEGDGQQYHQQAQTGNAKEVESLVK